MAGEITKELIGKILSELKDEDCIIVGNKGILCNKLNRYQILFMQKYNTSKRTIEITLTAGTYEYNLHPKVLRVLKCNFDNVDIQMSTVDTRIYTLILPDDAEFTTGDIAKIEAFIRPLQRSYTDLNVGGETKNIASDIISLTVDPIIEEEYYPCLVNAVLSEYRKQNPEFMPLASVIEEVKMIQSSMWKVNSLGTSGFSNSVRRARMRF